MQMQNDFLTKTIKIQKIFNFNTTNCLYSNTQSIIKNIKNNQDSQIKISNNFLKQTDNTLLKITQVKFGQNIIQIQDTYQFSNPNSPQKYPYNSLQPTNSSDSSNNNNNPTQNNPILQTNQPTLKKKMIFKRNNLNNLTFNSKRRNTKNIAKNFCKAFLSYLQNKQSKQPLTQTKKLVHQHNYNNQSIEKLANNKITQKQFKSFLTNQAQQWINSSKIHDKDIHTSAIQLYLQLINRQENQKELKNSNQVIQNQSVFYSDQESQNLQQKIYSQ